MVLCEMKNEGRVMMARVLELEQEKTGGERPSPKGQWPTATRKVCKHPPCRPGNSPTRARDDLPQVSDSEVEDCINNQSRWILEITAVCRKTRLWVRILSTGSTK